ncbi:MAG TPA: metallophosphoesterase, partial [Deltaproteobacteria bacterium]|nr:metallophosphoesterase [Deltaproteobacteria bacterium]
KGQLRFVEDFLVPSLWSLLDANPGMRVLYTPGNHDWIPAVELLGRLLPQALNIHETPCRMDGITFSGYACVTDSTFWVKDYARRDLAKDPYVPSKFAIVSRTDRLMHSPGGEYATARRSMEEDLSDLDLPDPLRSVCVFHCPPYATGIDTLHNGKPIGSRAIRAFLERTQPLLSLHGHIHEAPYVSGVFSTRVGSCIAANPGQGARTLHALVFDTDDPGSSLTHSVFGTGGVTGSSLERMVDSRVRRIKALFMNTALRGKP